MLPKLADDADAAKAVGGDRCYLSSPAASSQIVPSNKAINLIDQHISFIATFMLQLEDRVLRFDWKSDGEKTPLRPVILLFLFMNISLYLCILSLSLADRRDYGFFFLCQNTFVQFISSYLSPILEKGVHLQWFFTSKPPSGFFFWILCSVTCCDSSSVFDTLFSSPQTRVYFLFSAFIRAAGNPRVAELLEELELC